MLDLTDEGIDDEDIANALTALDDLSVVLRTIRKRIISERDRRGAS